MIDIIKAKEELKAYVQKYDVSNPEIKLRITHIERTSKIAKQIAENLNLSEENVKLAELIGLLHDIGRFEQIKKYNTFVDHLSEDHAILGIEVLFKQGLIRNFIEDKKYDRIIKLAIENHNKDKNKITPNLTQQEELHVKLIRDSDKIDILYMLTFEKQEVLWECKDLNKEKFSDEIYREFIEDRNINYSKMETKADRLIAQFTYAFDFYFKYGLKIVYKNNYYKKIYERFNFKDKETKKRYTNIYNIVNKYIESRL